MLSQMDPFGVRLTPDDLESAVSGLLPYASFLSLAQRDRLVRALYPEGEIPPPLDLPRSPNEYGADFDLADEVWQQILAVKAVREQVVEDGKIKDGFSARDAKDVVTAGNTLLTSLMRYHKEIVSMDRLRRLERSVIEVLEESSPEVRQQVMSRLEEKLSAK
jgi:hypothetical protein